MPDKKINKILLIRIDFLGDMVCTTALLHAMKQRWPAAEIHVLANKYNAPILDGNPDISAVHHYVYSKHYEKNIRPGLFYYLIDRFLLISRLRKLKCDLLVIPNGGMHKNAMRFARQLNVRDCRWHDAASEFDDRVPAHIANRPMRHEALSGFALLPELGEVNIADLRYRLFPARDRVLQWGHFFGERKVRVGLFVSNKSAERSWAADKWTALSRKIAGHCEVVIFHSPQDAFSYHALENSNARVLSTDTVPDLIAAMTHLDIVVSADSAPVHLASALEKPVVALFESRPEKYLRWYPVGVDYVLLHKGRRVDDIAVDSVYQAVLSLLAKGELPRGTPVTA